MTRAMDGSLLVALTLGFPLAAQTRLQAPPLADFSTSIEDLARASSPAVVQISVRGRATLEEGGAERAGFVGNQQATGSGVIVHRMATS